MLPSLFGARSRYPLYTGLLAVLTGALVAAALSLWGSLQIRGQVETAVGELRGICSLSPQAAAICPALERVEHTLLERTIAVVLLQGLFFALIVAGALLLARKAHGLLVRRLDAALGLLAPSGADAHGRDEVARLTESLAELSARQVASESEGRWQRMVGAEQLRNKTESLQALHQTALLFCTGELSGFNLMQGLALVERTLGARTVALCFGETARQALGTEAVLATHGVPAMARGLDREATSPESTTRIVPPSAICDRPSLVVPMSCGDAFVGMLVVEFAQAVRVDDPQVSLAESFAHLVALAISGVSRSREERRVALMEERDAIAAELHDSLAQSLGFMKIEISRLQRRLERDGDASEAAQMARELREGLSAAYGAVRELITAFRARMDPGGLLATVRDIIDEFGQRSSIDIDFEHAIDRCHLEVNEEFHVMQVVREALSNALRHADAGHLWVSLRYGPEHMFRVTISDDGRGLGDSATEGNHYGLRIMHERARSLGGELAVTERPGGGTRVELAFAPQRLPAYTEEETSQ